MSLPALLKAAAFDGSTLTATIGDDWLQGRTAYGGLSTAIALAATKRAFADLPPLRSAQIAFAGPLADQVSARPQLLRRGKNSAFVRCDVSGGDGTGLSALFLFLTPRPSVIDHPAPPMPEVAGPDAKPADVNGKSPGFLQNFDIALETNPADGYLRWARLKDRSAIDPEVEFMAIADALPPAAMALSPTWGTHFDHDLAGQPAHRRSVVTRWLVAARGPHVPRRQWQFQPVDDHLEQRRPCPGNRDTERRALRLAHSGTVYRTTGKQCPASALDAPKGLSVS